MKAPPHRPQRRVSGLSVQGFLTALLLLALLVAVGWLLTERNQRRYFLQMQGSLVVTDRGLPLPYGHAPFRPADPALARAYQPFHIPAGVTLPAEESFDDRGELDQRLGELLLQSARARLSASDDGHLEEGVALLGQLDALSQLSTEQRHAARQLRSEVAYVQAEDELARSMAALADVQALLKLGAESSNPHARDSADLLDRLGPAVDQLKRAARGQGILPADRAELPLPRGLGPSDGGI